MQEACSATRSSNRTIKCPSALLFLYRHVIGREVGDLGKVIRARKPTRLPVVMTRDEVKAVLATIQELLGHKDVKTTMIYTHVLNYGRSERGEVFIALGPPDQEYESPPGNDTRIVQWLYNEYRAVIVFTGTVGFSRLRLTPSSRWEFNRVKALVRQREMTTPP